MCNQCSNNEEPDNASERTLQEDIESSIHDDYDFFERKSVMFDDLDNDYDYDFRFDAYDTFQEYNHPLC